MRKNLGWLYGLLSAFSFALMALFAHLTITSFSFWMILFVRASVSLILTAILLSNEVKKEFSKLSFRQTKFLWVRGLCGGLAILCYFYNLRNTTTGFATLLHECALIILVLINIPLIYKRKGLKSCVYGILGASVTIGGIFLISGGGVLASSATKLPYLLIGITGAIFGAAAYLSLRKAAQKFEPKIVVFIFSFCLLILTAPKSNFRMQTTKGELLCITAIGILGFIGQFFLTLSYRHLTTLSASFLTTTCSLWAVFFDLVLGEIHLNYLSLTALVLIAIGISTSISFSDINN